MRSIKLATIKKTGLEKILEIYKDNIEKTIQILKYCKSSGIEFYRMGDLFPFCDHEILKNFDYLKYFDDDLYELASYIKVSKIRISMHSSPYCILATDRKEILEKSIKELEHSVNLIRVLNLPIDNRIVVHVGSEKGGKKEAKERFIKNYNNLSDIIKNRIALENDHKDFSFSDVYEIHKKCGIPIIFDVFHHSILNKENIAVKEAIEKTIETWKDGPPEIHYSNQEEGKPIGSHSNTINTKELYKFIEEYKKYNFDIILETKDGHESVERILKEIGG